MGKLGREDLFSIFCIIFLQAKRNKLHTSCKELYSYIIQLQNLQRKTKKIFDILRVVKDECMQLKRCLNLLCCFSSFGV